MSESLKKLFAIIVIAILAMTNSVSANDPETNTFPAEDVEFFEQKIRPVLVEQCYECHSTEAVRKQKLKGGLRVDSRAALLHGGDSGPSIIPGKPEESLLFQALRFESVEMPPKGKLPDQVLANFEQWIARGAADPRKDDESVATKKSIDWEAARHHWSYQPLQRHPIPEIETNHDLPQSPIDAWILSKLPTKQLAPVAEADRGILIRRVTFDLVGLPPSLKEMDDFLADASPDAWERVIDRLLASPHFGERWARHWLSVVRFGESLTLRGFVLPEAWRYRDYVIQFFNEDRPFDRFLCEQVAGDLLPAETLAERQRQLIATTFLTLGNLNLEEQDKQQLRMDVVDEQLEAIGKGFLAQTLGCARCHDHKFDPISTRDYYAMAGILANVKTLEDANVSKWLEFPLPLEPDREHLFANLESEVNVLKDRIQLAETELQRLKPPTVIAAKNLPGIVLDDRQAKIIGDWQQSQSVKPYLNEGYLHDKNEGKGKKTITFQPEFPQAGRYEVRLAYTPGDNRSPAVPVTIFSAEGEKTVTVNQQQRPPIDGLWISLGQYRFEVNGQGFVIVSTNETSGHVVVDGAQFLPAEALENETKPRETPITSNPEAEARLTDELKTLKKQLKDLEVAAPPRPKYMSVQEQPQITDLKIHIRGTVHHLGDVVPRGFLAVASPESCVPPSTSQSGRKELGEWLASPKNPLPSRVMSNRIWLWLFGQGLSRTPDNFGTTGDLPSHPELLDYLSLRMIEHRWSIKETVREIVQSHTYRQSSATTDAQHALDPENRWLAHQNRKRLDAECLLDAILTISGERDDSLYNSLIRPGLTEDYGYQHQSSRRAIYWPVFRNALPALFEVFDFADPSLPASNRSVSTVAPQALFFLNDPWVQSEVRAAAEHLLAETSPDVETHIHQVYRLTLGRLPTPTETRLVREVLTSNNETVSAWTMVVQALLSSIDFRYVE